MKKGTSTPSFILELEISFSDSLLNWLHPVTHKNKPAFIRTPGPQLLEKKFRAANRIYNAVLAQALRRMHVLSHDRQYLAAREEYRKCREAGSPVPDAVKDAMSAAQEKAGFTEFSLHAYACAMPKKHFRDALGADECQKLASRAYAAAWKVFTGQSKKARFHPYDEDTSIEGKSAKSTIRYAGNFCICVGKGMTYPPHR